MSEFVNFYYDPARQGYSTTLWKTVTGTPVAEQFDLFPLITDSLSVADVVTALHMTSTGSFVDTNSVSDVLTIIEVTSFGSLTDTNSITEDVTVSVI